MLRSFLLVPCLLICLACATPTPTPFPIEKLAKGMTTETVRETNSTDAVSWVGRRSDRLKSGRVQSCVIVVGRQATYVTPIRYSRS